MAISQTRGTTILVVDDNPADIALIREALKDVPCSIEVAANGESALQSLRSHRAASSDVRLVFADLNLPGLGGLEMTLAMRQDPALRGIPVVLLSSSGRPAEIRGAYEAGACCFIRKPADLEPVLTSIRVAFEFWCRVATLPGLLE